MYQRPLTSQELYHYGVIGMKWGIRRYQNYDGTYTQRGLDRYNKSKTKFEKAKADKEAANRKKNEAFDVLKSSNKLVKKDEKASYDLSRSKYKTAKSNYKIAKKEMRSNYKQLKFDKRADQGKQLYKEGYRILDVHPGDKIGGAGVLIASGGRLAAHLLNDVGKIDSRKAAYIHAGTLATGAVLTGVGATLRINEARKDKKLRAYYGH